MESVLIKLISSIIIGGLIGLERKSRGKPAGIVTNILVCMGATIIAIEENLLIQGAIKQAMEYPNQAIVMKVEVGRLTAQIISGIGFLGGGVIIQTKGSIKGITTAAILWTVAALGIVIGNGHLLEAYISSGLILLVLLFFKKFEMIAIDKRQIKRIYIEFYYNDSNKELINDSFKDRSIKISNKITHDRIYNDGGIVIKQTLILSVPRYINSKELMKELLLNDFVLLAKELK